MTEFSEFHFGGRLIDDHAETPAEMLQDGVNPACKKGMGEDCSQNGSDQKRKNLPLRVYIEARGGEPGGAGSGYAYVIAKTGETRVEWHDGWTHDEAAYQAISRGIEDVPAGSQVLFLTNSRAVVKRYNDINPGPGRLPRELLRLLARSILRMRERRLTVTVEWIPRKKNLARNMLDDASTGGVHIHHPNQRDAHR
jgi:ribonuclease HI